MDRARAAERFERDHLPQREADALRERAKEAGWNLAKSYHRDGLYSTRIIGPRTWEPEPDPAA